MSSSNPPLRFTISRHEKPGEPHFDLFLERSASDALCTFTVAVAPHDLPVGNCVPADRIADHRRAYLDFEGEVTGGRGSVKIVETGTHCVLEESDAILRVRLAGRAFAGEFALSRIGAEWTLRRTV